MNQTIEEQATAVARVRFELETMEKTLETMQSALYKTLIEADMKECATPYGTFNYRPTTKYTYSEATTAFKKKMKDEVASLEEAEKAEGIAKKIEVPNYAFLAIRL